MKRGLLNYLFGILLLVACVCMSPLEAEASEMFSSTIVKFGDADRNGLINMDDINILNSYRQGVIGLTEEGQVAGDVNRDGAVGFDDIVLINKHIKGTITITTVTFYSEGEAVFCMPSLDGKYAEMPNGEDVFKQAYTFDGWYTQESGGYMVTEGDSLITSTDHKLYAQWEPLFVVEYWHVVYNPNGGSGGPETIKVPRIWGDGQTIQVSDIEPTREGYRFLGWAYTADAVKATYTAGEKFKIYGDRILYAVWRKNDQYLVEYNANGGSGAPDSQVKTKGKTLTLSTVKPVREGYVFQGWGLPIQFEGAVIVYDVAYKAGEKYTKDADVELYAVWKKKQTITTKLTSTEKITYKKNKTVSIKATTDGEGKLSYKTSNSKVAKVSSKGVISIQGYGKATITVTASSTATYALATKKITITVVPKKMEISKVASTKSTRLTVSWRKISNVSGYQVYVSPSSTFAKNTKKGTFKAGTTNTTLKNLKRKTRYYVKIRAYKTVNGTKYYGAWSDVESIKIK